MVPPLKLLPKPHLFMATPRSKAGKPAPASRFSRPPLERMHSIHQMLMRKEYPNCNSIAEKHEVSTKTILRDITFMRDRLRLPIEYDAVRFGYYYTEPVNNFPGMEVTEGEIVALFVAQKAMEQYQGTPFEEPLRMAFKKISDRLSDSVTFNWGDISSSISFRDIGSSQADIALFETLSQAVLRSRVVRFEYRGLNDTRYERRQIRPYHLACVEKQWYLFGFDLKRDQLRTFALPRMRKAELTDTSFERPADFDISEHLGDSFGVFSGKGKKHTIRLRFDAFAARLVAERQWHKSQQLHPNEQDGSLEMTLQLGNLREITRWILSWSGHVQVLEPPQLIESVRNAAQAMLCAHPSSPC